jgi:hypothetical protein
MSAIDLDGFRSTPLCHDPYDYLIVPGFLKAAAVGAIDADYPHIAKAGSFPVSGLDFGPAFAALAEELQGPAVAEAFAAKFAVALDGCPTTITVRGRCRARDGRIHTDTDSKIITVLIYMNASWEEDGGRLRVLRSGNDLDDFTAEVPPIAGTMLAFRRSATSFHGHPPFVGERRVIQLNWVTDEEVARHEQTRHQFTARLKKLNPFG